MAKDSQIIKHILKYCDSIEATRRRFGDEKSLKADTDYFNSVCMQLLQIGELAKSLSDEFTNENDEIDLKGFKGARDVMAHQYHNVQLGIIWDAVNSEIPHLKEFCEGYLENN